MSDSSFKNVLITHKRNVKKLLPSKLLICTGDGLISIWITSRGEKRCASQELAPPFRTEIPRALFV